MTDTDHKKYKNLLNEILELRDETRLKIHLGSKDLQDEWHELEEDALLNAFVEAIHEFARFQQCEHIALGKVQPPHLAEPLRAALTF